VNDLLNNYIEKYMNTSIPEEVRQISKNEPSQLNQTSILLKNLKVDEDIFKGIIFPCSVPKILKVNDEIELDLWVISIIIILNLFRSSRKK